MMKLTHLPRLLVTRRLPGSVEDRLRHSFHVQTNESDVPLGRDALVAAMTQFDAISPTITDRVDAEMIGTAGATVRFFGNFGAGVEHIDLEAARLAGIPVTNTPDALTEATAEIAILLMLMAARRAGEGERELRSGQWTGWRPTHLIGQSISGKTLGLVGFGRIAQATAARARAFNMTILYHSRRPAAPDVEARFGATFVPALEDLAARSDILSLHVPGGSATRHLVNADLLDRMKQTAIFINTARGPIVDEGALATALRDRRIFSAGLDVFEKEPTVPPSLLALENVVLLPHLGSATIETRTAMGMQMADNLEAFFDGRKPPNLVS